ncbi:MAG: hypothetical protein AAFX04_04925 [Pseudomonadota bacterium]
MKEAILKIEEKNGRVVANDTQVTLASIDQAITDNLNLCSSILEVSKASNLPISANQPLIEGCAESLNDIVSGRRKMVKLLASMQRIQRQSNLSETAFGCPDGLHGMVSSPETATETVRQPEAVSQ